MGDGVSHRMRQGIPERRKHVCVQANVAAKRFEQYFLMKRLGGVANNALERRADRSYREEAQAVGYIAHLCKLSFDCVDSRREVALETFEVIAKLLRCCVSFCTRSGPSCPPGFEFELQGCLSEQVAGQLSRSLHGFRFASQRRDSYRGLGYTIEKCVHLFHLHAYCFKQLFRDRAPRFTLWFRTGQIQRRHVALDHVEHAQYPVGPLTRNWAISLPVGYEGVFDGVGKLGNGGLLNHPGGALERVREAQQTPNETLPASPAPGLEHRRVESFQQFASFDSEVLVLVFNHSSRRDSRLDQPHQVARQSSQLPRGL